MDDLTRPFQTSAFEGANAVVLGGAGFLGSHLCDRLVAGGANVTVMDNFITGKPSNIAHLTDVSGFRLVHHDVTDYLDVPGPVDFVLHFASPASPADYQRWPIQTLKVGSLGTHKALGLARAKGATLLMASTSEVYGDPLVNPQPESYWGNVNPVGPRGMYDEAKRFAEALCVAYQHEHAVGVRIARIFNTYGPRMRVDDGRAVPAFFRAAFAGQALPVHGGEQTRSLCYVDDMVDGLLRLLLSDVTQPVNLGNPQEISINALAEAVQEAVGQHPGIAHLERSHADPKQRCPDTTLAQQELGWKPTIDLAEGLARTATWFRAQLRDPAAAPTP